MLLKCATPLVKSKRMGTVDAVPFPESKTMGCASLICVQESKYTGRMVHVLIAVPQLHYLVPLINVIRTELEQTADSVTVLAQTAAGLNIVLQVEDVFRLISRKPS